jgi:CheY-like chemotaxis protein
MKQALETIERNAKLQTQLIDDLLDVSRILRGKLVLNVCPVDLVTVVDAAIETVRLAAEAKGIEIQKNFVGTIGRSSGDAGRLQQIVWNLLSNAVKFTPAGGRIEIWLEQVGTEAYIQVKDTGKGISPKFLPHVFEYFRQEDGTTTRKFGGLGLGLAIVRHLAELHGGSVKAESFGEGQGAAFTIMLPLLVQPEQQNYEEEKLEAPATSTLPLSGLRILVVDDEVDNLELVQFILEQAGATIISATSARGALQQLSESNPSVLISDIAMPEVDGYTLLRQVRALPPEQGGQISAIALTAYAGDFNQQQALQAGFQRHIGKPVDPQELIQAISALCSSTETWQNLVSKELSNESVR